MTLKAALALAFVFGVAAPSCAVAQPSGMNVLTGKSSSSLVVSSQARRNSPRIRVQPAEPRAYPYPRPGEYSWPGPGAVRQCVGWYALEARPSGTVLTPQQRCRWVRG
jgi:hypothetical protein